VKAIANWKDKEKGMRFNNNVERAKVKQAFLEGIVTGKLM
jgi:phage-related minor tail protein